MSKIKKWGITLGLFLFLWIVGVQVYQYYLVKGNSQVWLKNNMMLTGEAVSYKLYLDGELIKEDIMDAEFMPSSNGLNFYLKPGKHTITIDWIEKGITEEVSFYSFFLVKYIWIGFDDRYWMVDDNEINYHITIYTEFKLLNPYYLFA